MIASQLAASSLATDYFRIAYRLDAASRRVLALVLLGRALAALTVSALTWVELGALLDHCAGELRIADDPRCGYFAEMATSAYRRRVIEVAGVEVAA